MLYAILIPFIWFISFVFAIAREDKLKIVHHRYPTMGDIGFHLTGKARDSQTDYVWRNLWLHVPYRSFFIKFRVTKYKSYAERSNCSGKK